MKRSCSSARHWPGSLRSSGSRGSGHSSSHRKRSRTEYVMTSWLLPARRDRSKAYRSNSTMLGSRSSDRCRCTLPVCRNRKVPWLFCTILPCSARMVVCSLGSRRSSRKTPSRRPSGWRSRMWEVGPGSEGVEGGGGDEGAGLNDVGDEVGSDRGRERAQSAQALRRHIRAEHEPQHADDARHGKERTKHPPRRHAGGVHHDQLGIVGELVE